MNHSDHISHADKISREKSKPCHVGLITMAVGGRTDHIPMNVLEGSYVLPADIVSGLGEGNTLAGAKLIQNGFSKGPFGLSRPSGVEIPGPKTLPTLNPYNPNPFSAGQTKTTQNPNPTMADGGPVMSGHYRAVPIVAAGGEYVVHPDVVKKLGGGDINKGHDYLDKFVKGVRHHLINTLSKLPGPKRD